MHGARLHVFCVEAMDFRAVHGRVKPSMSHPDTEFVADYLAGDEESFRVLVRAYLKPIYSFVYRYVGSMQDAEDVTQEVFVKVWKNLDNFDKQRSFKTWIFTIAKNTSIDFLKKSRSASGGRKIVPFSQFSTRDRFAFGGENVGEKIFFEETLTDPAPLPDELMERASVAQILSSAMEKLSPQYRMVLFLRYNDHFTFREIAQSLEEPLHTVKSRHRRALIILKKLLAEG